MKLTKTQLRELIKSIIDEVNVTSNIDGGEGPPKTPHAFSKKKKGKKKRGIAMKGMIATKEGGHKKPDVFDYTLVEEITADDYDKLRDIIRSEIALIFFTLFKKRNVWI